MIDFREIDSVKDEGYLIMIDKDGEEIRVHEPQQKDLLKVLSIQQKINTLEAQYNKVLKSKIQDDIKLGKMAPLYEKLIDTFYGLFLFILNMNTISKTFALEDIRFIGFTQIKEECENYIKYVNDKTKK